MVACREAMEMPAVGRWVLVTKLGTWRDQVRKDVRDRTDVHVRSGVIV